MKYPGWILVLALLAMLAGCGSGTIAPPAEAGSGRMTVSITWPQPSRLIPVLTNSIKIELSNRDGFPLEKIINRPAEGFSTDTITALPVGDLSVRMTAYPDPNATGNPLAIGSRSVTILEDQTVSIDAVMNSTIDHILVNALISSVSIGATSQLAATSLDAAGNVVLIPPFGISWASETPQIASVDQSGLVTGIQVGTATIRAVENESGKAATFVVKVEDTSADMQVTDIVVTPAGRTVSEGRTLQLTITARNANHQILAIPPQRVSWLLAAPPGQTIEGGATISPTGLLTAERAGDVWVMAAVTPDIDEVDAPPGYAEVHIVATQHYNEVLRIGQLGGGNGQFNEPAGVAVDQLGNVYVADRLNNRVQKFDNAGNFLLAWGGYGSGNGQFHRPCGIAVDQNDNVYVTDLNNYRVQKFTAAGQFLLKWGTKGNLISQFMEPRAVEVDQTGRVFVLDSCNMRVQVFNQNGEFLDSWGKIGLLDGLLWHPSGLAVYPDGTVLVGDLGFRVQQFTSAGVYQSFSYENQSNNRWWNREPGSLPGQFLSPGGITIDTDGNFYVADLDNMSIQKFDANATYITGWGTNRNGLFATPTDVAVDNNGFIFVADMKHNQIVKFEKIP